MKPILYSVNAFDTADGCIFPFQWGGNQAFKNNLIISRNDTNEAVYDKTEETMQLRHTLPPNLLTNGVLYNASVTVYDRDNNPSETSDRILFYCFTRPSFSFGNLTADQVVQNSHFNVILRYSQAEEEELESYRIFLYSHSKTEIYSSALRYDTETLSVPVSGLTDNTYYYIQATGKTVNNMYVDTGLVPFTVDYVFPTTYATLVLENNKNMGSILIRSNIVSVELSCTDSPPRYLEDDWIDLRNPESYLYLNRHLSIPDDYTFIIKGKGFSCNIPIFCMSDGNHTITVLLRKGKFGGQTEEKAYFELVSELALNYVIFSNYLNPPAPDTLIKLEIQHQNGIYRLSAS